MMHGVAANSTTTTTSSNPNTQNSGNNGAVNQNSATIKSNTNKSNANMMQQEMASPHRDTYKQDALNFGIKLKDTNSVMYSEQQQRKLEMLESRFVPLNPQKVYFFTQSIRFSSLANVTCFNFVSV